MSVGIAGMGWVTPLGRSIQTVWERLLEGETATAQWLSREPNELAFPVYLVSPDELKNLPPHPRLRRASAISRFAAAAGLDALQQAGDQLGELDMSRTALIFAVSDGGVVYTTRFYREVVKSGAQSASPLLFPETVFNAPASHLAAILGITGTTYTLVGDGAVGILALKMAEDLMAGNGIDQCLVIGAEEADWVLCDAFHRWRLINRHPPIEPFQTPARGTILSEGAGAVVLARTGPVHLQQIEQGTNYGRRSEAGKHVGAVLSRLAHPSAGMVIASANGTFVDGAEQSAIAEILPGECVYAGKAALGESVGSSAIWQVIVGAQALLTQSLPRPQLGKRSVNAPFQAIILACGMNQQVAGLRLAV